MRIMQFKLSNMVPNPSIVMIAKRGSGKSYIVRDLIYHFRSVPGGVIIAPTDKVDPYYKYFFPDLFIHYEIKEVTLKKIMIRQSIMLDKEKNKKREGKKVNPCSVLVMDDCLAYKKSWSKDETILNILMNGRHYKLMYILTMQTPLGVPPELRFNFDYVFLLKEDSAINKKKLWDNYASIFQTLSLFNKVFSECTENFSSMVIDNRKPASTIQEKIYWFKAKKRKFVFGSKTFRELHKKYYDPNALKKMNTALLNVGTLFGNKKRGDVDVQVERV